jgi:hypothetical protein
LSRCRYDEMRPTSDESNRHDYSPTHAIAVGRL